MTVDGRRKPEPGHDAALCGRDRGPRFTAARRAGQGTQPPEERHQHLEHRGRRSDRPLPRQERLRGDPADSRQSACCATRARAATSSSAAPRRGSTRPRSTASASRPPRPVGATLPSTPFRLISLESIEVSKTLKPDMDGDSIGGTVDLVTRGRPRRLASRQPWAPTTARCGEDGAHRQRPPSERGSARRKDWGLMMSGKRQRHQARVRQHRARLRRRRSRRARDA